MYTEDTEDTEYSESFCEFCVLCGHFFGMGVKLTQDYSSK